MCFCPQGDPNCDEAAGTEKCAKKACGSGSRWCNDQTTGEKYDRDAPWATLGITGTSDGTPRTSFWQSVCWIDPFMPAVPDDAPFPSMVAWTNGAPYNANVHNDVRGMFRTFTAPSLWFADSMTRKVDSGYTMGRGGITPGRQAPSSVSYWNLKTPYIEPYGGTLSLWSRAKGNALGPHIIQGFDNTYGQTSLEDIFNDPGNDDLEGIGLHTCADQVGVCSLCQRAKCPQRLDDRLLTLSQNNRTFFAPHDFGQRGFMDQSKAPSRAKPAGEAWDLRWSLAKFPLGYPTDDGTLLRGLVDNTRKKNVDHQYLYTGPIRDATVARNMEISTSPEMLPLWDLQGTDGYTYKLPYQPDKNILQNPNSPIFLERAFSENMFPYGFVNAEPSLFWVNLVGLGGNDVNMINNALQGISPYWVTPPGAWGMHTPANPPWIWPGLVMRDRETSNTPCPTAYTAAMSEECKKAAWAPPMTSYAFKKTDDTLFRPEPIFDGSSQDAGPAWPPWAFEMMYGWHSMAHMGRVDWDAHTLAWNDNNDGGRADYRRSHKFEGEPTVNMDNPSSGVASTFKMRWTVGPYPLRGKNDGLLEYVCAASCPCFHAPQLTLVLRQVSVFDARCQLFLAPTHFSVLDAKDGRHLPSRRRTKRR